MSLQENKIPRDGKTREQFTRLPFHNPRSPSAATMLRRIGSTPRDDDSATPVCAIVRTRSSGATQVFVNTDANPAVRNKRPPTPAPNALLLLLLLLLLLGVGVVAAAT